ncbi:RNA polymerase sigma factor [Micromonospora globbae]|uniref:Sigma-70 family RNA polymerase sigma factor n=1 Tax=Micromonospora globbae TaxID=1894969 RepID=A0A420EE81_9ACTN|nr:sigma-70 family RNA polymerase sigma factor [Micromonospora globbae]RKF18997.1 sigma-70 family RNA polymerase sigma factor [Micromonospora globbae]
MPQDKREPPPETGSGFRDFDEFFRLDYTRVIHFVRRFGATWQEAEDAAQEAMAAVYKRWNVLSDENPRGYARTVAEHAYARSRVKQRRERESFLVAGWPNPNSFDLDDVMFRKDTRLTLWALSRLPIEQRRVFAWAMDGFSHKQIAEFLGKPEATVRSNYRHARNKLAELLAPYKTKISSAGRRPDDEQKR